MSSIRVPIQSRSVARSSRPGPLNRSTGATAASVTWPGWFMLIGCRLVSTLIGSLRLSIVDVATDQSIFSRVLGFRGDTDEAWRRAVRFFVRDPEATAAERR